MPEPLVITIILNTNRREDTLACLASLAGSRYGNHRIIVLDNASNDSSVAAIQAAFPDVEIIELEENLGYAGNNNVGVWAALKRGADWVFVLNEDTVVAPDCLSHIVGVGQSAPDVGVVGPMVYHYDEPDVIQSAGGRLDRTWHSLHVGANELDEGQFPHPRPVDWISGCAIMVRRELIEAVGALDERFFYYWEETEWCLRAGRQGWQVMHAPQAKLWHKGVQRDYRPSPSVTYYNTRNRLLILAKYQAPLFVRLAAWGEIVRTLTSWTLKPRWRRMHEHRNAMWQGALDFLRRRWGMRPA